METNILIAHLSGISVFIPLSFAFLQWRKLSNSLSLLRWLLICNVVTDITQSVLGLVFGIPNGFVGDIYLFQQFAFLLFIFHFEIDRKKILKITFAIFIVLYAGGLLFLRGYPELISILHALMSLVLIIVCIVFFHTLLSEMKVDDIHRLPILWIAFGVLLYYSGNLFVFVAQSYLLHKTAVFGSMWVLHNLLNIIKNIFFAIALWRSYKAMK